VPFQSNLLFWVAKIQNFKLISDLKEIFRKSVLELSYTQIAFFLGTWDFWEKQFPGQALLRHFHSDLNQHKILEFKIILIYLEKNVLRGEFSRF
jgi:hypothetical protein